MFFTSGSFLGEGAKDNGSCPIISKYSEKCVPVLRTVVGTGKTSVNYTEVPFSTDLPCSGWQVDRGWRGQRELGERKQHWEEEGGMPSPLHAKAVMLPKSGTAPLSSSRGFITRS